MATIITSDSIIGDELTSWNIPNALDEKFPRGARAPVDVEIAVTDVFTLEKICINTIKVITNTTAPNPSPLKLLSPFRPFIFFLLLIKAGRGLFFTPKPNPAPA